MTRPFTFRYQPMLTKARADERARQRDMAVLIRKRIEMHEALRSKQESLSTSKRALADALTGRVDLSSVGAVARFGAGVEADGHAVVRELAVVERQVVEARERLLVATRQRRSLERLEEKGREQWRRDNRREDQQRCDEAGQVLYANREPQRRAA
ncbi:MAG: flagellar FliJ family protein [Planctomycetota bacterium]